MRNKIHRSKPHGSTVYYFKHSGIEHVFHRPASTKPVQSFYLASHA